MDSTQRGVLGGFGGVLVLAAIAWAGLFPKGHEVARIAPAVGMAVAGIGLVVVAYRGSHWGSRRVHDLTDRRQVVKRKLVNVTDEGRRLLAGLGLTGSERYAIRWQTGARHLLSQSLSSPDPAQIFHQMGPDSGRGIAVQLRDQTEYLDQIARDLPMHDLKDA